MRTTQQCQLVAIALILIVAVFFFHQSWSDLDDSPGNVKAGGGAYEAKEEPGDALEEPSGNSQNWKQVVLDELASAKKEAEAEAEAAKSTSSTLSIPPSGISTLRYQALATTSPVPRIPHPDPSRITPTYDRVVVVGRLDKEDTRWVFDKLPDWQHAVYVIDNPSSANMHTIMNKGREAMAYLTYIIENYETLPATIVFVKSHRARFVTKGHHEGAGYDAVELLRTFNIDFVQRNGYASLRCAESSVECSREDQPFVRPWEDVGLPDNVMSEAWRMLFRTPKVPKKVAGPLPGEFAVSRQQVRKRPLSEYQHYLDWLIRTPLDDETSGKVFEKLWHVIFGQSPIYCPETAQCYCDLYKKC
ncbi:uncharacterized protein EI97DRAFT_371291 [Westerdykella ornata]|uniref:Uncharacterized protein n=1 Tax=Westerdykella ornata TaxID=318751 RepID=A0A6A6JXL1_WESOR|nr:uncharacterized protein EI97DRAFT_371291 [Westerdykella ornata]KAF2279809.1 hypothetical protein EI97DRAFT_371291 [Westerdykella ornata]